MIKVVIKLKGNYSLFILNYSLQSRVVQTEEQEATNFQIGVQIPTWLRNKNGSVERNW